jgi:hypothetical protein
MGLLSAAECAGVDIFVLIVFSHIKHTKENETWQRIFLKDLALQVWCSHCALISKCVNRSSNISQFMEAKKQINVWASPSVPAKCR